MCSAFAQCGSYRTELMTWQNAQMHDRKKKYKYFYCIKDYLVVKVSCVGKDIDPLIQV